LVAPISATSVPSVYRNIRQEQLELSKTAESIIKSFVIIKNTLETNSLPSKRFVEGNGSGAPSLEPIVGVGPIYL